MQFDDLTATDQFEAIAEGVKRWLENNREEVLSTVLVAVENHFHDRPIFRR